MPVAVGLASVTSGIGERLPSVLPQPARDWSDGVADGSARALAVGQTVAVEVGVTVAEALAVGDGVALTVAEAVGVAVGTLVAVGEATWVDVALGDGVSTAVGTVVAVPVGTSVGDVAEGNTTGTASTGYTPHFAPTSKTSISRSARRITTPRSKSAIDPAERVAGPIGAPSASPSLGFNCNSFSKLPGRGLAAEKRVPAQGSG